MNKLTSLLRNVLAFSLAGWLICNCARAQDPDTRDNHRRFKITIGGGWAEYYMPRISGSYPVSDEYSWPSSSKGYGRISGGPGAFFKAGYDFWKKASIFVGVIHLSGAKKGTYERRRFLDDYNNRGLPDDEFRASMTSPLLEIQYTYPMKPVEFFVAIGVSYIVADASYSQVPVDGPVVPPKFPWEPRDFHSRGIGYLTGFGVSYGISRTIFVNSETGYRFLKTDDLQDDDGRTWQDMNLNFSGPYMMASLSVRL